ncbi:MAG: isocitrate/isopropylmalate family dehydrogenase [Candidatus Dormibacteria bacterium]
MQPFATSLAVRHLLVLGGDGIGPEVTGAALQILVAVAPRLPWRVEVSRAPLGRAAFRDCGEVAPAAVLQQARRAGAVLLGAVDTVGAAADGAPPGSAVLALRHTLGCFAALRPVRGWPGTAASSPIRASLRHQADLLFVRELAAGAYAGPHLRTVDELGLRRASDGFTYSPGQVRKVALAAFRLARQRRGRVTSVAPHDALAIARVWRGVLDKVAASHPDVDYERMQPGEFAVQLLSRPTRFDVVVTENLMGDILSDEAAALAGALGLLPSASLGRAGLPSLYEPIHGAAPEIAGRGVANPVGAILTLAMLLGDWGAAAAAVAIEKATDLSLQAGIMTPDLGGSASTKAVTAAIAARL